MKQLVVDTDVISYIFKQHPLAGHYVDLLTNKEPVISFTTLAEMRFGALEAKWGFPKRNLLEQYLSEFAVCYPDDGLCSLWAEVTHESKRKGHPISAPDAWIAATARYLDTPLVTHNSKHYAHLMDLVLLDQPIGQYEEIAAILSQEETGSAWEMNETWPGNDRYTSLPER